MNVVVAHALAAMMALGMGLAASAADDVRTLHAADHGLTADGQTDDGPAISRLLDAAAKANVPTRLVFPKRKTVHVTSGSQRYALRLRDVTQVTIDGGGCLFLLGPDVRFLHLSNSRNVAIANVNIDFAPLPFVDGTIVAINESERFVDVRVAAGDGTLLRGGPTQEDGEQAFFGMLWHSGSYGLLSRHYWIKGIEPASRASADTVRAFAGEEFAARQFGEIVPRVWRVSLPVAGVAHRFGPGACLELHDNDTVALENVELWSAPWFGFRLIRNRGEVTFRNVNVRPKPNSGRLMSTWRDGFHVKGNSAALLWEDCIVAGMNDDAFNLSTHTSNVQQVASPTTIVVQQRYPLELMPWHEGERILAVDFERRTRLGESRIVRVTPSSSPRQIGGHPAASPVILELDRPIAGLERGAMVWEPAYANPRTTLRRCTIENSCRLQTPVTLESCKVTGLLWFHGEEVEGPFPSQVAIRDSALRRGRGNGRWAVSFVGPPEGETGPSAIHDVVLERNDWWGGLSIIGVDGARVEDNRFREKTPDLHLEGNAGLQWRGNRDSAGQPLPPVGR